MKHSPDDDAFIIPDERVERDNLHRKLMATARSLKKQKQRLKAAQKKLSRRWNKVLDTEERYGDDRHTKGFRDTNYCQNSTTRPFHQRIIRPGDQKYRFTTTTEQLLTPRMIYMSIWIRKPVQPGPSMDLKDTPRRGTMVIQTLIQAKYQFRISTGHNNSRLHATTRP